MSKQNKITNKSLSSSLVLVIGLSIALGVALLTIVCQKGDIKDLRLEQNNLRLENSDLGKALDIINSEKAELKHDNYQLRTELDQETTIKYSYLKNRDSLQRCLDKAEQKIREVEQNFHKQLATAERNYHKAISTLDSLNHIKLYELYDKENALMASNAKLIEKVALYQKAEEFTGFQAMFANLFGGQDGIETDEQLLGNQSSDRSSNVQRIKHGVAKVHLLKSFLFTLFFVWFAYMLYVKNFVSPIDLWYNR